MSQEWSHTHRSNGQADGFVQAMANYILVIANTIKDEFDQTCKANKLGGNGSC